MSQTPTTHIHLDAEGRAWIDDTNVKVIEVAIDSVTWKWGPEAIHLQYPHLSMAQIHAALAFYYDHQTEFDAEMERMDQEYQARRAEQTNNSPLHQKLRAAGKAP